MGVGGFPSVDRVPSNGRSAQLGEFNSEDFCMRLHKGPELVLLLDAELSTVQLQLFKQLCQPALSLSEYTAHCRSIRRWGSPSTASS